MQSRKIIVAIVMVTMVNAARTNAHEPVATSSDHATVQLFFVNQWMPAAENGNDESAATAGGLRGRTMRFETASLFLNDKFVGHTIFRHVDVSPRFNLPAGDYKFRIECDGYRKFEKDLTVLGGGSLQWLVVKLERETSAAAKASLPALDDE